MSCLFFAFFAYYNCSDVSCPLISIKGANYQPPQSVTLTSGRHSLILACMSSDPNPSHPENLTARFAAAPLELKTFTVFAAVVALLGNGLIAFGPKSLKEAIIPITGRAPGTNYMFTLFFACALIFAKRIPRQSGIVWRFAIIAILAIGIFGGLQDMKRAGGNDFGNPYLTISPLRPLWTIIIPILWIVALLSPRINKFLASRDAGASV
jgi:hypothetical protein